MDIISNTIQEKARHSINPGSSGYALEEYRSRCAHVNSTPLKTAHCSMFSVGDLPPTDLLKNLMHIAHNIKLLRYLTLFCKSQPVTVYTKISEMAFNTVVVPF